MRVISEFGITGYQPNGHSKTLNQDAILNGEDVLPEYNVRVTTIFPAEEA